MEQDESQPQSSSPPSPSDAPAASPGSSTGSSADSTFIGDPGPAFEQGAEYGREGFEPPEPGAPAGAGPATVELGWEEDSVRSILTAKGGVIHMLAGVGEEDWIYTEADLAAIAPPLTRILNRYPVTQAAAGTGDEMALVIGLGGYATRSYMERKAVLDARADKPEEPITGRAAEEEPDPPQPEEPTRWTTDH